MKIGISQSYFFGDDLFVEDYLPYYGESERLEIDSDKITYFLADHQDKFDTIELMDK